MYRQDAKKILATDPTLMHFYYSHTRGFVQEPVGVWVMNAGLDNLNGFYRQKEATDGPPRLEVPGKYWIELTAGQLWFEKDDGCYIRWSPANNQWWCIDDDSQLRYEVQMFNMDFSSDTALPPAAGWKVVGTGVS